MKILKSEQFFHESHFLPVDNYLLFCSIPRYMYFCWQPTHSIFSIPAYQCRYSAMNDPSGEGNYIDPGANINDLEANDGKFVLGKPLRKSVDSVGAMYDDGTMSSRQTSASSISGMYNESSGRKFSMGSGLTVRFFCFFIAILFVLLSSEMLTFIYVPKHIIIIIS